MILIMWPPKQGGPQLLILLNLSLPLKHVNYEKVQANDSIGMFLAWGVVCSKPKEARRH